MKVSDAIDILKAELNFSRTPSGRSITEQGEAAIEAALSDENNMNVEVMKCINCSYINSSLLFPRGCPNCGSKDLGAEVRRIEDE